MADDSDLETQPLLPPAGDQPVSSLLETHGISSIPHHNETSWRRKPLLYILSTGGAIFILLIVMLSRWLLKITPSMDQLQDNIVKISDVEVTTVHLDGWRKTPKDKDINNVGGKVLQVSTSSRFFLNYDLLPSDKSDESDTNQWVYKYFGENILHSLCFGVNNATTFNTVNETDTNIASVTISEPFCIDLTNGTITDLNLTLLIEPHMKNILRVLKKLWNHDYKDLNLWSNLDVTVYKKGFKNWNLKLANLHSLKIHWKDILDWEEINIIMTQIRDNIDELQVEDFKMTDSDDNFEVQLKTSPITVVQSLLERYDWISIPDDSIIPSLAWDIRLPDCKNKFVIDVPTLQCATNEFDIKDDIHISVGNQLGGPLPDKLMTHVCNSDGENAVTPLTNILNAVMNSSKEVVIQARGSYIEPKRTQHLQNILVPPDILNLVLGELDYFPISSNMSLNITDVIQEVVIEDMILKWIDSRIRLVGTMTISLNMSFYETQEEKISVHSIKGDLQVYHEGNHFLSIPMKVWTNSTSRILHHDNSDNNTYMEITFDIKDDELEVVDKMALSKCMNEVFFLGESSVSFDSVLDVVSDSVLGEIVLSGLKSSGETLIH